MHDPSRRRKPLADLTMKERPSAARIGAAAGPLRMTPNVAGTLPDPAVTATPPSSRSRNQPTSLAPGDVHVWYRFTDSLDDDAVQAEVAQLSPDEGARCQRFVFRRDRRDFAAGHALLRRVLSMYDDVRPDAWTFVAAGNGKPSLAQEPGAPPLAFNLSHTQGLVACAVARDAEVGVDVECVERVTDGRDVAERYFSAAELAQLDACPEEQRAARFIELWTLKEAYLKAIGSGLARPLDTFAFSFDDAGGLGFNARPDGSPATWTFALFAPSPRHRLALAARFARPSHGRLVARAAGGDRALAPVRACTSPA
jgi:4'-phosphopantetheinyl transferase